MKTLFLTRSYSKDKGGKEIYNYNLYNHLKKKSDITLIATSGSIIKLIWFYPYALFKALTSLKGVTNIHLGDNFMLPLAKILKLFTKAKISITLYGLELTYQNKIYKQLFLKNLKNIDQFISISNPTKQIAIEKGIPSNKIKIIPCAINPDEFLINKTNQECKKILEKIYHLDLKNKKVLFTNGRLVKRKGVQWFIENVMTKLNEKYLYFISGDGKEKQNILNSIKKQQLQKQVFVLGRVSFQRLKLLYNSSDFFIMPNIQVSGDMEGFGIVAIEAGSCGITTIASKIEGIQDAIINGKTGWFVQEKNSDDFIKKIKSKQLNKKTIQKIVQEKFTWDIISNQYIDILK